ncbi:MAG: choice-of-anchor B family protein, partial [Gemmatimonadota bacterium]|nr:choice-of-anchor B family protein [Gemmatimonadota bacterium]
MSRSIVFGFLSLAVALVAAVPTSAQSFGSAAAVSGDVVLFGQPDTDATPGTVYVYGRQGDAWAEVGRLHASDAIPGDRFGTDLDVSGDRMIVGALWADSGRGGAYVFEKGVDGAWTETARLVPESATRGDSVGAAVALEGDLALVTSRGVGDSTAAVVHAFRRGGDGAWSAIGTLDASEVTPEARFGTPLDLAGTTAFVGAVGRDSAKGAVFAFPIDGDAFGDPTILTAPEEDGRARFGAAILADEDRIFVGAPGVERARGAVIVLEKDDGEWAEADRLLPFEAAPQTLFGAAIARSGDEVWVGAPGYDRFQGAVFSLRRDPETKEWSEAVRLDIDDLSRGDFFSGAVALADGVGAVGLPGDDYGAGTAAVFEPEGDGWRLAARLASDLETLDPVLGGSIACEAGQAAGFSCENVDLVGFLPVSDIGAGRGVELNDVWGWTDPETGREYALVGRVDGTSFIDVTDPRNPLYLGELPKTDGSPGSTWRDIKVYEDHAFVVADNAGHHGVQIFDLTRLRNVEDAPATFDSDGWYGEVHSAHNIVINTDSGFAYAVGAGGGGETCGGGLHMIDIRDPLNPTFAGCFADPSTGRQKTGYSHDAQCVTYHGPDERYSGREICFGSNETALSIADVTDKENPVAVAMVEYPNVGYTHQSWLTEDHKYLLTNDELDETQGLVENTRTLIWDVTDLDDPVLIKEYMNPEGTAIDHNLYVKGDKVFQSNYVQGLRVLDISDIENPREVGHFDTVPYGSDGPRFAGSWSNYP